MGEGSRFVQVDSEEFLAAYTKNRIDLFGRETIGKLLLQFFTEFQTSCYVELINITGGLIF